MEIKRAASVENVRPATGPTHVDARDGRCPSESVSLVDASRMEALARVAQAKVNSLRLVRLAHIEHAIRQGNYQPSASQIASRLLEAAEIDEHMRAVLA
jgi:anti-sigma28 factor (negative regulator of flagellin synthesis)